MLEQCVETLKQEDNKPSWRCIENITLFTPFTQSIINKGISLERSLYFDLSELFINNIIQQKEWSTVTEKEWGMLMKKGYVKAASTFLLKKGTDRKVMDSPLRLATQCSLTTGNKIQRMFRLLLSPE